MSGMTHQQDAMTEPKPRKAEKTTKRPSPIEIGKLFEKLPPHAIEAEMSLLGSMMLEPEVIGEVVQVIRSSDDFFKPAHGSIYDALIEEYNRNSSKLDLVTLHQQLLDRGVLDAIGGQDYLADLAMSVPSAAHADFYARMVRDKAILRRLIQIGGEMIHEAYNRPDSAQAILDEAEKRIFEIAEHAQDRDFDTLAELLQAELKWFEENTQPRVGLLTGFTDYDHMTGGLQQGEFVILAARPSMGKTSLALNLAEQIALGSREGERIPVGFFSLEMSRGQLVHRMIAAKSGVDMADLQRNNLNQQKLGHVVEACDALRDAPVVIDDTPGLTLLQLRAKARRMHSRFGIRAIFVDYLQLLSVGHRTESRQVEVSEISRGLKAVARELSVPVVCLSQLNRGPEQRDGHRPRLSDLRESGSIEQDADVVLLLHSEDYYRLKEDPEAEPTNLAEVIVAKQRNGPTGTVRLVWDASITRFKNAAFGRHEEYA